MADPIRIQRGRTEFVPVSLSYDITNDIITSQIREQPRASSPLIATFTVTKTSNSSLLLALDDSVTSTITQGHGYMDIKRVVGGEPFSVFHYAVEVIFQDVVTP